MSALVNAGEAWRGRGRLLTGASPDTAGFDWKIQRAKVRYLAERDGSVTREWPDLCVLFRSDDKEPLAVVTKKFKVQQPEEILQKFYSYGILELGGLLHGGKVLWALTMPQAYNGPINSRLLLRSRIGQPYIEVRLVAEFKNCLHLLALSPPEAIEAQYKAEFAGRFPAFVNRMRAMADHRLEYAEAEALTRTLLIPANLVQSVHRESRNHRSIMTLFASAYSRIASPWDWVCAVAEHIDWLAHARTEDERLEAAWFGRGAGLKAKAVALAINWLEVKTL